MERDPLLVVAILGREIYWSLDRSSEITLNAYVCPGCGRVCLYVRKLEANRNTILKAPIRKSITSNPPAETFLRRYQNFPIPPLRWLSRKVSQQLLLP